jgi:hypothetical protein
VSGTAVPLRTITVPPARVGLGVIVVGGRAGLAGRVCRCVFLLNRTTAWTTGEGLGQRVGMTNPGERQPDGRADQAAGDQPVIERLLGSPEHRNAMRLIRASGHEDDQEERGGKQNRTEKGLALLARIIHECRREAFETDARRGFSHVRPTQAYVQSVEEAEREQPRRARGSDDGAGIHE